MSNGDSKAPTCPINHSQDPSLPRGTAPTRLPAIPIATDLPSLIRSVNIMRDILRNISTSLTINNTFLPRSPRPPRQYGDKDYIVSPYPDWYQVGVDNSSGYVGKDPKHRANIERLNTVVFRNNERDDDNLFKWNYKRPLTAEGGGNEPFEEDFFERVVEVHWRKKKEPDPPQGEFYDEVIMTFSAISASYWNSEFVSGLGWVGTEGTLAGGSTNYGAEVKFRNEFYYVYGQRVIAEGFSQVSQDFGTDQMPFSPRGYQILTGSGSATSVTLETHDAIYGYGDSATITFGTVKLYPFSTSGWPEDPHEAGVEFTYTPERLLGFRRFTDGLNNLLIDILYVGRQTAWPPQEPTPDDGEDVDP